MSHTAERRSSSPREDVSLWWEDLDQLLEALRSRLVRILGRYGIPPQDREDLLQATFLVLCYKRDDIRDPEAWLVATLRNRCLMYWRERRWRDLRWLTSSELIAALAEVRDFEELLGNRLSSRDPALRWDLARALERLPHPWAQVVRLRILGGCSKEEAAAASGYRPSSVRKILAPRPGQAAGVLERGWAGYATERTGE